MAKVRPGGGSTLVLTYLIADTRVSTGGMLAKASIQWGIRVGFSYFRGCSTVVIRTAKRPNFEATPEWGKSVESWAGKQRERDRVRYPLSQKGAARAFPVATTLSP